MFFGEWPAFGERRPSGPGPFRRGHDANGALRPRPGGRDVALPERQRAVRVPGLRLPLRRRQPVPPERGSAGPLPRACNRPPRSVALPRPATGLPLGLDAGREQRPPVGAGRPALRRRAVRAPRSEERPLPDGLQLQWQQRHPPARSLPAHGAPALGTVEKRFVIFDATAADSGYDVTQHRSTGGGTNPDDGLAEPDHLAGRDVFGGEYGPYLIPRFFRWEGRDASPSSTPTPPGTRTRCT